MKNWIYPILFTLGGALAGLGYYDLFSCSTGSCSISASPVRSMIYMGLIGLLLSVVFRKGREDSCSM